MKVLFLLVLCAVGCQGRRFGGLSRRYQTCEEYMRARYPACKDAQEDEICARRSTGPLIYQRRVESEKCSTGFAGEFNQTSCGYMVTCTQRCESELKYVCEPTLEEKAALLVESLSLGVDAEDKATEAPTQSSAMSYFSRLSFRGRSTSAKLSTNQTCPADPANNPVCKDVCTATDAAVDPPKPSEPLDPDTPVEPFNFTEFNATAARRRSYRCCGNQDEDRYVLFILDTSSAVGELQFMAAQDFVCDIVKQLCGTVKIGLATYDSVVNLEFCFDCHKTREDVCAAIGNTLYRGLNETHTASAVKCATKQLLSSDCGLPRNSYRKRRHVDVVFITSGENNGPCRASLTRTMGYYQSLGYATHVISASGAPDAFQLVNPYVRNFTNVVILNDLVELFLLSASIESRLSQANSAGDLLYSCNRDSAQCRRKFSHFG